MEIRHEHERRHKKHEKHRNVLYAIVLILLTLQIISFISLSSQVSKVNASIESTKKEFAKGLQNNSEHFSQLLESYDSQYQKNFNDIVKSMAVQQTSFDQEITLLKAGKGDFSGIIEDAVKGVVAVGTDKSSGTGFIINHEGYIVTNAHVITDAARIAILTYDKKILPAKLIGTDSLRDIAVLKIDGNYPALEFGDSDKLGVGNKVIAIGNPLGLSFSVTEGIISALKRPGPNGLTEYVQTDVSLNPGSSGGPLIDTSGKVIGINNFKVGGAESLGFALESNAAKEAVNLLTNKTIAA